MRFTLALPVLALAAGAIGQSCSGNLTAHTSTGSFTGVVDDDFPNVRQWRSIPYAQPPVGSRRWLPPKELAPSDEHHYTPRFPPSCSQFVYADPSMYFWASDYTRGNLIYNGGQNDSSGMVGEATSEDCLYLAVWAPAADAPVPEGGFPVVFFMTGGGFVLGGVDIPWQKPTSWVERSQSHIVVTINYRVGIMGFPNAAGLANEDFSQNFAILDQRMALEWVRDNIESFGGNPNRISQMGRSAGANAADTHAFAWHDDPIAESYFLQSGSMNDGGFFFEPDDNSNFTFVAQQLGCGAPCDSDDAAQYELDCMRSVSVSEIVNFVGTYMDTAQEPFIAFVPIVDERVFFRNYSARVEAGLVARVPTLVSTTSNEGGSLIGWPEDVEEGPDPEFVDELNVFWTCKAWITTRWRNSLDIPVYRMQYAGAFPNLTPFSWLGAYHASDIPAFFGTYGLMDFLAPSTKLQMETSEALQDYYLSMVKDPWHGPQDEFGWEPMDTSEKNGGTLLRLGAGGKAVQFVDGVEVDGACEGKGDYDAFPE